MMNRFVTIFFIHAVLCLSTNCLSQAKTSNENLSPEFTGQKYFESSGLYYFNNRYYDPALGRFLTPDPLQQYASPYSYADGDPLGRVDPSGLIFERLAELASSAFRALTSCCRGGVTEELGKSLELRSIRPHNDPSGAAQGAVGGRISDSPETIQDISRAVSEDASLTSSLSIGVEEQSFQDPYYSPGLEDRLQAIDEQSPERVQALQNSTRVESTIYRYPAVEVDTFGFDKKSKFMNYYSKDFIKFMSTYRSDESGYYLTDVIRNQYRLAAREGNFSNYLPRELKRLNIINKEAFNVIKNSRYKSNFLSIFLLDTVNGRSSLRVMNEFGLIPTQIHVDTYYGYSVTISVAPDPNPIPVDQLQKAQKNLSDRLDSLNLIN